MYESPITQFVDKVITQIIKTEEDNLVYEVQQATGYNINKEELIKALRYDRNQYQKGYEDGRKGNEWIPVSERLPEKSTWVLVTCKNPDGYIYLDIKLINRYTGLWDGDEDFIGTVLAWQPLPEPYRAESEDK